MEISNAASDHRLIGKSGIRPDREGGSLTLLQLWQESRKGFFDLIEQAASTGGQLIIVDDTLHLR